MNTRGTCVFI